MRIPYFIMLILVSLQVMFPCMDEFKMEVKGFEISLLQHEHKEGETHADGHDHGHDSEDSDHCSPFCTCACCQANYLFAQEQPIPGFQLLPRINPELSQDLPFSFFDRIWHPPKV